MRILLAEDAALLREGLIALLERAGHTVTAVATATELEHHARSLVAEESLDLVLTDVRMPPGNTDDGLRVAVALRTAFPDLPILVLSQYITHDYATALLTDQSTSSTNPAPASSPAAGIGYLLKDRVSHVHDFLSSLETVRSGGIVVDPAVITSLMQHRPSRLATLTDREQETLGLVSEGAANHQIARTMHLSEGAVVKHISAVFAKLGISEQKGNRRVLAVLAYLGET